MINREQREGYVNRHTNGIPKDRATIEVIINDADGEHIYVCDWKPFDRSKYLLYNMPHHGYLGTATVIDGIYKGIGFNVWEQNNSEFVWYKIIQPFEYVIKNIHTGQGHFRSKLLYATVERIGEGMVCTATVDFILRVYYGRKEKIENYEEVLVAFLDFYNDLIRG